MKEGRAEEAVCDESNEWVVRRREGVKHTEKKLFRSNYTAGDIYRRTTDNDFEV